MDNIQAMESAISTNSSNQTDLQQDEKITEVSDIKFDVDDHTVYANKTCLSLHSPVLRAMFNSDFKEKTTEIITLPGKSAKGFIQFIEVTHLSAPITMENMLDILPIAKEYQCDNILTRCDDLLVQAEFSVLHLAVSGQHQLEKSLRKFTECAIEMKMQELKKSEHFDRIPEETLVKLYELALNNKESLYQQQLKAKEWELKQVTEKLQKQMNLFDKLSTELETCQLQKKKLEDEKNIWLENESKLNCLFKCMRERNWPHSHQCERSGICYPGCYCSCERKRCDHDPALDITCGTEDSRHTVKYKNDPVAFYYNFQMQHNPCKDCIQHTLWGILQCLNHMKVTT